MSLRICGIKFAVFPLNLKKKCFMKKKIELKKLKLVKKKIMNLTNDQMDKLKGGITYTKTIDQTYSNNADGGCGTK
jgi:hypothetical protein